MFTGIIDRSAPIEALEPRPGGLRLRVSATAISSVDGDLGPWADLRTGESIAVDGCCLTLVEEAEGPRGPTLAFDVIEESLRRTSLGARGVGDRVNLERALRVGDRLGGHYVTGHIDGPGTVSAVRADAEETVVTVEIPPETPVRVIHKGSITIDGVSLTVASVDGPRFTVALIPHTLAVTTLGERRVGDRVNLEMDPIGRWVESLLTESGALPGPPGGDR